MKFGGINVSPDESNIFKTSEQAGSVSVCNTGFGRHVITPEELDQKIKGTETDIETIKKDIKRLETEINELKLRMIKKYV